MDVFTREILSIEVNQQLKGNDVVGVMNRLLIKHAAPKRLFCNNGSEFTDRLLDLWAYQTYVSIEFSRPKKQTGNAYIESFNGSFRHECLNTKGCYSLIDARVKIEAWWLEYIAYRPHKALIHLSPLEYVATLVSYYSYQISLHLSGK